MSDWRVKPLMSTVIKSIVSVNKMCRRSGRVLPADIVRLKDDTVGGVESSIKVETIVALTMDTAAT